VINPEERDHPEDQGVEGRMPSDWFWGRLSGGRGGFSWLRIVTGSGLCEYGDEPSGSGATDIWKDMEITDENFPFQEVFCKALSLSRRYTESRCAMLNRRATLAPPMIRNRVQLQTLKGLHLQLGDDELATARNA
jgi:hypothetical protein